MNGLWLKLELQCELQVAIVRIGRSDLAHRWRPDVLVREAEEGRVCDVEGVKPELDVVAFLETVVLHKGRVNVYLSGAVQDAAPGVAISIRRRSGEVAGLNHNARSGFANVPLPSRFGQLGAPLFTPVCR